MDSIIEVKNVSMCFNLEEERTDTIKEYFLKRIKRQIHFNEFYALKNVSLSIKKGDAVALVGVNGSGKSTLLKVIAGVLYPSEGSVEINGSIAPLIELGAGFDDELTARENIYLNGAILGHDTTFMNRHFDEIVRFSELESFIDVPIKNYSSGMKARLGFSIATVIDADILVVDEVLSVGDYRFQEKCKKRIKTMMEGGTTLLFVSHDIDTVMSLCNKAVWLDHGKMLEYANSTEICDKYIKSFDKE